MRGVDTRVRALPEVRRPGPTRATSVLSEGRLGGGNAARVAKRRPEDRQSMQASRTCRGPVRTHVVRGDGLAGLREGDPVPGVMLSTSTPMVKGRRCCDEKAVGARFYATGQQTKPSASRRCLRDMPDDNRYDTAEAGPYAHTTRAPTRNARSARERHVEVRRRSRRPGTKRRGSFAVNRVSRSGDVSTSRDISGHLGTPVPTKKSGTRAGRRLGEHRAGRIASSDTPRVARRDTR